MCEDRDADSYTVSVDGGSGRSIGIDGSLTFSDLAAGDHAVELSNVASNCSVSGSNPRTVTVPESGSTSTTYAISCNSTGGGSGSGSVQITGSSFDASSHNRFFNGTDIFAITWAIDGHLYTMGGNGDGWDGTDTLGLNMNRLAEKGPDGDLSLGTEMDSKVGVPPKGIISIDGTFYRFEEERADADWDGSSFADVMIGRSLDLDLFERWQSLERIRLRQHRHFSQRLVHPDGPGLPDLLGREPRGRERKSTS